MAIFVPPVAGMDKRQRTFSDKYSRYCVYRGLFPDNLAKHVGFAVAAAVSGRCIQANNSPRASRFGGDADVIMHEAEASKHILQFPPRLAKGVIRCP
jgi:hypothetical protein